MTSAPPTRRKRRRLLLVSLVLVPLAIEGCLRVRQYARYGTFTQIHDMVMHPEVGAPVPRAGRKTASMTIDSLGFRNPELEVPKPAARLRLGFLGGSTTFCAEVSSDASAWPARLTEGLRRRRSDLDIDFVNAAVSGYTVQRSTENWRWRLKALDPDIVFIYHASNDITADTRELAADAGLYNLEEATPSFLERHSLAFEIFVKNVRQRTRMKQVRAGERSFLKFDPEACADDFAGRLENLVREIQANGTKVVLVTFAHRSRPEMTVEELEVACSNTLIYRPYMSFEDLVKALAAYNDRVRATAERTGAVLIEAEGRIAADGEHYADAMHLTDKGCARLAEIVLEGLEQNSEALLPGPYRAVIEPERDSASSEESTQSR